VPVARFAFQAHLIDRSSISPFKINRLRAVWNSVAQNPLSTTAVPRCNLDSAIYRRGATRASVKLCKTSFCVGSYSAISIADCRRVPSRDGESSRRRRRRPFEMPPPSLTLGGTLPSMALQRRKRKAASTSHHPSRAHEPVRRRELLSDLRGPVVI
jgi:hypothetical protein